MLPIWYNARYVTACMNHRTWFQIVGMKKVTKIIMSDVVPMTFQLERGPELRLMLDHIELTYSDVTILENRKCHGDSDV